MVNPIEMKSRSDDGDQCDGNASRVVCVNFTCQGPMWGCVQRCFELAVHVDGVMVFGDGRQWSR